MRPSVRTILTSLLKEPMDSTIGWPVDSLAEAYMKKWIEVPKELDHDFVITQAGKDALRDDKTTE